MNETLEDLKIEIESVKKIEIEGISERNNQEFEQEMQSETSPIEFKRFNIETQAVKSKWIRLSKKMLNLKYSRNKI